MLHRGLLPSHLSFLLRHIIQARRFGLGMSVLLGGCVVLLDSPFPSAFTCTLSPTPPVVSMAASVSEFDIGSFNGAPVAT